MKEERWVPVFIRDKKNRFLFKWHDEWETYHFLGGKQREGEKTVEETIRTKIRKQLSLEYGDDYGVKPLTDKFRFIQYSLENKAEQYYICYPHHIVFLKKWEEIEHIINKKNKEMCRCKGKNYEYLKWFSIEELSTARLIRGTIKVKEEELRAYKLEITASNENFYISYPLLDIMWNMTKEEEYHGNKELLESGLYKIEESVNNILVELRRSHIYTGISSKAFKLIDKIKEAIYDPFERPILLIGNPGTGKSTMARAIHNLSKRGKDKEEKKKTGTGNSGTSDMSAGSWKRKERTGDFDSTTLAGISDENFQCAVFGHTKDAFTGATGEKSGLLERCHGGTAFLDEVTSLTPSGQQILLNTLGIDFFKGFTNLSFYKFGHASTDPVKSNVRIISATNQKPFYENQEIRFEGFRPDLTARLAGHVIELPDLKDIKEEWDYIIDSFLRDLSDECEYKEKFLEILNYNTEEKSHRYNNKNIKFEFKLQEEARKELTGGKYSFKGNFRSLIRILADSICSAMKQKDRVDGDIIHIVIKKEHLPDIE